MQGQDDLGNHIADHYCHILVISRGQTQDAAVRRVGRIAVIGWRRGVDETQGR